MTKIPNASATVEYSSNKLIAVKYSYGLELYDRIYEAIKDHDTKYVLLYDDKFNISIDKLSSLDLDNIDIGELQYQNEDGTFSTPHDEIKESRLELMFPLEGEIYSSKLTVYRKDLILPIIDDYRKHYKKMWGQTDYAIQIPIYKNNGKLVCKKLDNTIYGLRHAKSPTELTLKPAYRNTFDYICIIIERLGILKKYLRNYVSYMGKLING